MSKVIFGTNKDKDFRNHLIQLRWRNKTGFTYSPAESEYFDSLERCKDELEQWKLFEDYSREYYLEDNKQTINSVLSYFQTLWNNVEEVYVKKMEEMHNKVFPYKTVYGYLSTSPGGWGFNLNKKNPWFACPNKKNDKFLKVAMHELMHGFFIEYFRDDLKEKYRLTDNKLWDIQESLTVLLNIELGDILPHKDLGYPQHKELREEVKSVWLETSDIDEVLRRASQFTKG